MNLKSLEERITKLAEPTHRQYEFTKVESDILAKTIKLNEEVGELCNDILAILKLQRKSKLDKFDKRHFYEEVADVLITLMQVAALTRVDVERAVNDKLKKIEERYVKDHNTKENR